MTTPRASTPRGPERDRDNDQGGRLSAVDGSFLRLESAQVHMHVGFSAIFAPPADHPRPSVQALRERAAGRLHEVPWCRWRLDSAPFGLGDPRWVPDADFDLRAHIVELTKPDDLVSYDSFDALRGAVLSTPLDRSRPLWQIFLVPHLRDGRVGMVGKIHHALVDGIAALGVVNLVLDPEPDVTSDPAAPWRPRGRPGAVGWALHTVSHTLDDSARALRGAVSALTHPGATADRLASEAKLIVGAVREDVLPRAPQSALNATIGARRAFVGYHAKREDMRAARAGGGTLNDVGLAVVAGALRALALRHGDPADAPLKAMVPVSTRRIGDTTAGNQIAMVSIPLPTHLDGARERLDFVRDQTRILKHTERPATTQAMYQAAALLPPVLRSPLARAMAGPRQFNITVSQSPAPRGSLYLLGCELEQVYSVVPITQGHALAIGMVRYRQELFFGCYADPGVLDDVHGLPALLESELHALGATGTQPR
ncbi:MAG: wax ester/triacylglycerol synthase family O-acyltransferase, partial [Actinomycetota bacterium]|nr:wax ester/triacylglycerol synthase family O-acyltransferase [Actinomycetota bacterium]